MEKRIIHCEPGHQMRRFSTCDWFDNKGNNLFHERDYEWSFPKTRGKPLTPAQLVHLAYTEPSERYWMDVTYTDLALANKEATLYGFVVQMHFYCDENEPAWFPIFNDFDKALAYLNAKTKEFGQEIEYVTE